MQSFLQKTIDKFAKCNYNTIKVCEMQWKEWYTYVQKFTSGTSKKNMTNQQVADYLHISRVSYENKKKTGKFVVTQITALCELFECSFEYLFATDEQKTA